MMFDQRSMSIVLYYILSSSFAFAQETIPAKATGTSLFSATQSGTSGIDDPAAGDASSSGKTDSAAGAAGSDTGSFGTLSRGGLIAIIVVVSCVVIFGIISSILFYLAKKRSWEVRASIRKSAKRVAVALTPRRSEFPKSVKDGGRSSRGRAKLDDVPPTPRLTSEDIEKANGKLTSFEMREPKKSSRWPGKRG